MHVVFAYFSNKIVSLGVHHLVTGIVKIHIYTLFIPKDWMLIPWRDGLPFLTMSYVHTVKFKVVKWTEQN